MSFVSRLVARAKPPSSAVLTAKDSGVRRKNEEESGTDEPAARRPRRIARRSEEVAPDPGQTFRRSQATVEQETAAPVRRSEPADEDAQPLRRLEPAEEESEIRTARGGEETEDATRAGRTHRTRAARVGDAPIDPGREPSPPMDELANEPAPPVVNARRSDGAPHSRSGGALIGSPDGGEHRNNGSGSPALDIGVAPALTPPSWNTAEGLHVPGGSTSTSAFGSGDPARVTIEQVDVTIHEPTQASRQSSSPFDDRARRIRARFARRY